MLIAIVLLVLVVLSLDTAFGESRFRGEVRMENQQYLTALEERPDLNQSKAVSLGVQYDLESQLFSSKLDLRLAGYPDVKGTNWMLSEAYFASNTVTEYTLGRRLFLWSEADSFWNLGIWQPQNKWDGLKPIEQGFIGVFAQSQSETFNWVGFVSPANIPSMGPDLNDRDGRLTAKGRWFSAPGKELNFRGRTTPISYTLETPAAEKIISYPGIGTKLEIGDFRKGGWIRTAAAYKPVNQILGSVSSVLRLQESESGPIGSVRITPYIIQHSIASLDMGWTFNNTKIWIGHIQDNPQNTPPHPGLTIQHLNPLRVSSIGSEFKLWQVAGERAKATVSYIKISGSDTYDEGPHANPDRPIFSGRTDFKTATKVKFVGPLLADPKIENETTWLRDFEQKGVLLSTEFRFFVNTKAYFYMGADILGVDNPDENTSANFLNQYRANDRYSGGFSYVF